MFETPILLIIFRRPHTTRQVFERIRQIRPKRLYVAANAPSENHPDETKLCAETRTIIDKIDWPCEMKTLLREKHLECKISISSAITWFFEQEEYGVILEDDCLPDLSFFPFCEELLIRYKDDERIGHISGNCFFPGLVTHNLSYDFCSIAHIWGWASWRRVWKNYDVNFLYWHEARNDWIKRKMLFQNINEEIYFSSFLADTLAGKKGINTWDVQYLFTLRAQNQLSICPAVNLVTNIGITSADATHKVSRKAKRSIIEAKPISFPLIHPQYIIRNKIIDDESVKKLFFSWKRLVRYFINKVMMTGK